MELLLRLTIGAHTRDLVCEAEPDATVGDLIGEICQELAITEEVSLFAERLEGALDPATSLVDSGLVSGDTLTLYQGRSATYSNEEHGGPRINVILEVSGGPHQGTSWTLAPGNHTLGRATGASLHLPDPALAFGHLDLRIDERGEVYATAFGDVRIDGHPVPLRREYAIGRDVRIVAGASQFTFKRTAPVLRGGRDKAGQILFNRTPYFPTTPVKRQVGKIPSLPVVPEPQPVNWLYMVLPVLIGGVLYAVTRNVMTLAFVALSPLMLLANSFYGRNAARKRYARQKNRWMSQTSKVSSDLAVAMEDDKKALLEAHPSTRQLLLWAQSRSTSLWCRRQTDDDFMTLRLGAGVVDSYADVEIADTNPLEEYDEDLVEVVEHLRNNTKHVTGAPVTANYAKGGVLGVWGEAGAAYETVASLVLQAATLHSPEDLTIVAAIGNEEAALSWLAWLPHTRSTTSPIEGRHIVTDPNQGRALCDLLNAIASSRSVRRVEAERGPHILAVITEKAGVDWSALSRMLDQTDGTRVTAVWLGATEATLPKHCSTVLAFAGGTATLARRGTNRSTIVPETLDFEKAEAAARQLAPLRDAASSNAAASIPRTVQLSTLLGGAFFDQGVVAANWAKAPPATLRAPIGMDADGPWFLNMIDDGPHALIAGTSGAGKSELLQTIVASMAAHYPPTRLNFLFVDYKGGAAFGDATALPHTVGMVTDLDATLSLRALTSLRAELKRRETLLHGKARDIAEYEKKDPKNCPPRLMIVVDEFATLVKEIPDFVAGMVDVAQRGRSLGIHMILATQRPAGAVSDNILANTNLRICLRVLDTAESTSVIGTSDAAHIPSPLRGRSYIRTGPRDLHAVQTGWANAPLNAGTAKSRVRLMPLNGVRAVRTTNKTTADGPAEFKVAVKTIVKAGTGLPPMRRPWLDPLPEVINLDDVLRDVATKPGDPARSPLWGMVDDPANQAQYPAAVDLEEDGGLLILGSAGSGKTTVLRTIATSIAASATPAQAVLYGVDYGNRSLEAIEALPHCAGVHHGEDTERITAFMQHLDREIKRRRRLLSENHVSSFTELIASGSAEPRIVVLFDNFAGFTSAFERVDAGDWLTMMLRLVGEGRQAGVNFVITADRRASVPSALMATVSGRLILRMAEPDEYIALGVPPALVRDVTMVTGRGFFGQDLFCQVAVPAGKNTPREQRDAIALLGKKLRHPKTRCGVPLLENHYTAEALDGKPQSGRIRLGITDVTGDTAVLELRGHVLIAGRHGSGRSTLLRHIAAEVAGYGGRALFVGGNGSACASRNVTDIPAGDAGSVLSALVDDATIRTETPLVILVDDAETISDAGEAVGPALEKHMRRHGITVIAALEPDTVLRAYSGWIPELRRGRRIIVMKPDPETVSQVTGSSHRSRPGLSYPVGRAILVEERTSVIQTIAPN